MPQENTSNDLCASRAARITGIALHPVAVQSHISRPMVVGGAAALALLALGISGCMRTAANARPMQKPPATSKAPAESGPPGDSGYKTLVDFGGQSSSLENFPPNNPLGGVTPGPDGNLYGTLKDGGKERGGALYRFDPKTNAVTILTEFEKNGGDPDKVIFGGDGLLYGTINGMERRNKGCVYRYDIKTGAFKILVKFGGADTAARGLYPVGSVMMSKNGRLYGVTSEGGTGKADNNYSHGGGTLYQVDAQSGVCTTLVNFGAAGVAGSRPNGDVTQGSDGRLYGTTAFGGRGEYGTLYRYDPASRVYATLFEFNDPDAARQKGVAFLAGCTPRGVIFDNDNNLYGVSSAGGTYGGGVLYRFNLRARTLTPLVQLGGKAAGGKQPDGRLCWGKAGWLYGTTFEGGAGMSEMYSTAGTLFRYNVRANEFHTLVNFHTPKAPPQGPVAGVAIAADGALYGTTMSGGKWGGGVLYRVTPPTR